MKARSQKIQKEVSGDRSNSDMRIYHFILTSLFVLQFLGCRSDTTGPRDLASVVPGENDSTVTNPKERWQLQLDTIIQLVTEDRVADLAARVHYPLRRENPIPDIMDANDFMAYYPMLFDSVFKAKLTSTEFDSSNTIHRYLQVGIFLGDLWMNEEGEIIAINYRSAAEIAYGDSLHTAAIKGVHPSVKPWEDNIYVCQAENRLVRVDRMADGVLRFVLWSGGKDSKAEPDLILYDGIAEFQGTMGGVTYTFALQDQRYIVDKVSMAESDEDVGLFLRIEEEGKPMISYRCAEIKSFSNPAKSFIRGQLYPNNEWKRLDADARKYATATHDLNSDGILETLLAIPTFYFCGSGGCNLWVLDSEGNLVSKTTVVDFPIGISIHKTNGWLDIFTFSDRDDHVLKFDGKRYSSNASTADVISAEDRKAQTQVEVLSNPFKEYDAF
jgi:hypothetical protein